MGDDYDKTYFSGGTPKNREQWRAQYDRGQEYLEKERAAERQAQERIRQSQRDAIARIDQGTSIQRDRFGDQTGQHPIRERPKEPLKSVVTKTAMMFMVGTGLWFFFAKNYPVSLELAKVMVAGYVVGASVGVAVWILGWVVRFVVSLVCVLVTVAFWATVIWAGFHMLAGR
jgi:hypothetical protein